MNYFEFKSLQSSQEYWNDKIEGIFSRIEEDIQELYNAERKDATGMVWNAVKKALSMNRFRGKLFHEGITPYHELYSAEDRWGLYNERRSSR